MGNGREKEGKVRVGREKGGEGRGRRKRKGTPKGWFTPHVRNLKNTLIRCRHARCSKATLFNLMLPTNIQRYEPTNSLWRRLDFICVDTDWQRLCGRQGCSTRSLSQVTNPEFKMAVIVVKPLRIIKPANENVPKQMAQL